MAGSEGCGKTSFVRRFMDNSFTDSLDHEYRKLSGTCPSPPSPLVHWISSPPVAERIDKTVTVDGKPIKLSVARLAGNVTPQVCGELESLCGNTLSLTYRAPSLGNGPMW